MKNLNDRVIDIYNYSKLNQKKFAEKIGVSPSMIGDIIAGRKGAGKIIIEGVSRQFPEINSQWFISGEGPMLKESQMIIEKKSADEGDVRALKIQMLQERINELTTRLEEVNRMVGALQYEKKMREENKKTS